jgi:ribosomal protein S18 acetylase RimI-like enzyme
MAHVQVDSFKTNYARIFPAGYLAQFTYEEQEQDWRDWIAQGKSDAIFVAVTEAGEVAGYALGGRSMERPPYESELVSLHIRPEYQKLGLGRRLIGAVSQELYRLGCKSLFLYVLADNPSRAFYEKLGGVEIGERAWEHNAEYGTNVYDIAYGWKDITVLFSVE